MSKITVNTSQNVTIAFDVASIGDRIIAFVVDLLIIVAYFFAVFYSLNRLGFMSLFHDEWSQVGIAIVFSLPATFYTLVSEILMEGQTLGKRLMGIKVIKIDGYQASFGDYVARWFFRLIDIYSNGGAVGIITMIVNKNNQRFGGLVSGTAVISLKNKVNISHTILQEIGEEYQPIFPQVIMLSDNDINIVKFHFDKAVKHNDLIILEELTQKLKSIMKIETLKEEMTHRQFIDSVLKDYNYYTGRE
ncbi:RDD family protein [Capnocytophaga sp. ARDL2]|uniref:RDD family protein n=1 Tax=Capnocytophaga sp. ARDL2 TaxID=3238809 RepID=UPI00355785A9